MEYREKQVQIMEAAEKLFAAKGFDGTSVRDIAVAADVNLAMISYYFGSKEKLMETMFRYRSDIFKLQLESMIRNKELNPFEKVNMLIDQYIEKLMNQQSFHRVMVREQMVNSDGPIPGLIAEMKKQNQELIGQLILEGQNNGDFKKDIDVPFLLMTLVGTVSQLITTQHFYREINELNSLPEDEFQKLIRLKLSQHLKKIFKAILTYES